MGAENLRYAMEADNESIDVDSRHGVDHFVCADTTLCTLAAAEGFAVINPMTATP
ncbi:MAG: hypothetical protein O7E52_22135 [Candidatus Poribacteria bacterium]|nr:hypothetical protein [Candidatus Poribacteria bacterium]